MTKLNTSVTRKHLAYLLDRALVLSNKKPFDTFNYQSEIIEILQKFISWNTVQSKSINTQLSGFPSEFGLPQRRASGERCILT